MPDDWRKRQLKEEHRQAQRAAVVFEEACKSGNPQALYNAADLLDYTVDSWPLVMKRAAALGSVSDDIQHAFLAIWTAHKGLGRSIGHRPTLAKAVRVLLPKSKYEGPPIRLYRGTTAHERRRHLYTFSWTSKRAVADRYACKHNFDCAVVLETLADAAAVLQIREKFHRSDDEDEYILDPYKLTKVGRFWHACLHRPTLGRSRSAGKDGHVARACPDGSDGKRPAVAVVGKLPVTY
jgi:hypothetical protein